MGAFAELKKFRGKIFLCCIVLAVAAFSSMFLPTIMSDIIDNGINVGNMDYILKNGSLKKDVDAFYKGKRVYLIPQPDL